jgi:hypothetical protein
MPVEDSLVVWDEAKAPFQRVAVDRIPRQDIDLETNQEIAEALSFNPASAESQNPWRWRFRTRLSSQGLRSWLRPTPYLFSIVV